MVLLNWAEGKLGPRRAFRELSYGMVWYGMVWYCPLYLFNKHDTIGLQALTQTTRSYNTIAPYCASIYSYTPQSSALEAQALSLLF